MIEITGFSEDNKKVIIGGVETDPVEGTQYHDTTTDKYYNYTNGAFVEQQVISGGGADPVNPPAPNPGFDDPDFPIGGGGNPVNPPNPGDEPPIPPIDPDEPASEESYGVNLNRRKFTDYRLGKAEAKLENAEIEYTKDDNGILSLGSFASKAEARAARIKLFLIGLKGYIFKK